MGEGVGGVDAVAAMEGAGGLAAAVPLRRVLVRWRCAVLASRVMADVVCVGYWIWGCLRGWGGGKAFAEMRATMNRNDYVGVYEWRFKRKEGT